MQLRHYHGSTTDTVSVTLNGLHSTFVKLVRFLNNANGLKKNPTIVENVPVSEPTGFTLKVEP